MTTQYLRVKAFIATIFLISACVNAAHAGLPSNSIYHLPSTWLDQNNKKVSLNSLEGEYQIVAMIYTHCLHTCPIIVSSLQLLEKELKKNKNSHDKYNFVLVSLTPQSDTPKVLNDFAVKRKLNPKTWTLLSGSESDVRSLAMLLNIKYKQGLDEEVAHSNIFTVLDKNGTIMFQEIGNYEGVKNALKKLNN